MPGHDPAPRTPVLVGVGSIVQRADDPATAAEATALMAAALERAADDAGSRRLLAEAGQIAVPRGFWDYTDPGRLVADALGARTARTVLAEIGILQQTVISDACRAIAAGEVDVALVVGGEARARAQRARRAGVAVRDTVQAGVEPDRTLRFTGTLWAELEAEHGLVMPVNAYAIIESALRHADRMPLDRHRAEVAALWAGFSAVAAGNPHAWTRTPVDADAIATPSAANPMLALPYTKLHNSQWTVDQAAGLILCSVATARAHGIAPARWVFPLAGTESNHVLPVAARAELHRSPGFAIAGARARALAGVAAHDLTHVDLYSCFPVAVRVQARELGLAAGRPLTVTGGMTFAGGPLNSYVLQATARMAELLRRDRGATGLVTSVSGMLTKQGCGLWSTTPPARGFQHADVTEEVARETAGRDLVPSPDGVATIAGYTVVHVHGVPSRAIAVCTLEDGRRTVASGEDPALLAAMAAEECCGRRARVARGGTLLALADP